MPNLPKQPKPQRPPGHPPGLRRRARRRPPCPGRGGQHRRMGAPRASAHPQPAAPRSPRPHPHRHARLRHPSPRPTRDPRSTRPPPRRRARLSPAPLPPRQHRRRRRQRPRPCRSQPTSKPSSTPPSRPAHDRPQRRFRPRPPPQSVGASPSEQPRPMLALTFWWLDAATVHALMITLIAAVYIGFAVSDGRANVILAESIVVVALLHRRRGRGRRDAMAPRGHLPRPRRQGPLAASPPLRPRDTVVAAVLLRRRRDRRRDHRHPDPARRAVHAVTRRAPRPG